MHNYLAKHLASVVKYIVTHRHRHTHTNANIHTYTASHVITVNPFMILFPFHNSHI